jgi:glycosyltransferase involved in cell wall biosynthesis
VVVPNGASLVDELQAPAANEPLSLVRRLRDQGRFVIGYAGGHNAYHGLANLIDAAARLQDRPISFVLVGEGDQKSRLENRVARLGLESFHFMPRTSRTGAFAAMQATDAIFVGLRPHPIYRFGIGMNKIYDGMAVGRPIVAAYTAGNDPVGEAGCGITVPAGDATALADAFGRMMSLDAAERDRLGASGRSFVLEHHEYGVLAGRFTEAIEVATAAR